MTSYSDYIAAKRIYTVNNGSSFGGCNDICMTSHGPIFNGDCSSGMENCAPGPTGPPGDTYMSYFTKIFYTNRLFTNCIIGIKIDQGLAYLPGMNVKIQAVLLPSETDIQCFYGIVSSYDKSNGVLAVYAVSRISTNFSYGISKEYIVNIDNTGPTGPPVSLQATANQTTVNNTTPTQPVIGIANNLILGNSLTFSSANPANIISYGSIGTSATGFTINDNVKVSNLFFTSSADKSISHTGSNFTVNDDITITGNTIIGNTTGAYNSILARIPENAATTDSYTVRMAYNTAISGIGQWQLFASTSTAKEKANIETLPDSTSILDVRPVSYNPISPITGEQARKHIGFIAEEMAQNELGNYFVIHDEDGSPKSIQYELMIPLYASAMRALRARCGDLEATVALQGEKIAELYRIIQR